MPTQAEMWNHLGHETVDLLIVGGGINGAGIARDAARRGLKVALVEMRDLAYGTSSRSSKMVHGGLRYLEQFAFGLVFESVSERRILLNIAPHLVRPLPYIFPVFKDGKRGLWMVSLGMWLYEALSLFRSPIRHKTLKAKALNEVEPIVDTKGMVGAPLYYDCATDDARLTLESALDAASAGAVVSTWSKVTKFEYGDDGRVRAARVLNQLTGEEKVVHAKVVINATGPWTDKVRELNPSEKSPMVMRSKGVHAVVQKEKLPVNHCIICPHPDDARGVFAVPWGDQTYIGTTDTEYGSVDGHVAATLSDIDYLLEASNAYFPDHQLSRDDVISTWAGLRPLLAPETDGLTASQVSREHKIEVGPEGIISVAGGKLTTYRKMSAEVVDVACQELEDRQGVRGFGPAKTDVVPLPGASGLSSGGLEAFLQQTQQTCGGTLEPDIVSNLVYVYGVRAARILEYIEKDTTLAQRLIEGRPEIRAQVAFAVEEEFAATVTDFLIQRTQIFYRDSDQGLSAVDDVTSIMGDLLHWDEERRSLEASRYRKDVDVSREWRLEINND